MAGPLIVLTPPSYSFSTPAALAMFDYADGFQGSFWARCDPARDVLVDILLERVVRAPACPSVPYRA